MFGRDGAITLSRTIGILNSAAVETLGGISAVVMLAMGIVWWRKSARNESLNAANGAGR